MHMFVGGESELSLGFVVGQSVCGQHNMEMTNNHFEMGFLGIIGNNITIYCKM